MNKILVNTHKQENINMLKIREYYFNKAKRLDKWLLGLNSAPIIIAAISALFDFGDIVDGIIGIISIIIYFVDYFANEKIDKWVSVSNMYRELYDVKVLEITENLFSLSERRLSDEKEKEIVRKVKDSYKCEIWYEEIFSRAKTEEDKEKSDKANVICCQLDNLVYSKHAYKDTVKYYNRRLIGVVIIMVLAVIYCLMSKRLSKWLLILTTIYGLITLFFEKRDSAKKAAEDTQNLVDVIMNQKDNILNSDTDYERMLQDMIIMARNQKIFLPMSIRRKFLREHDNPYYEELDDIKNKYYEKFKVYKPSCASEIDMISEDGRIIGTFDDLHKRLFDMMSDVTDIWNQENINYSLDGGTLIGAVRKEENGGFIFWDDDVDLAIPYNKLEDAKKVIKAKLGDKYEIQDYQDKWYSPRLANFRVRDKKSKISEKDSELSENYKSRGLFLDVYCYAPILYNKTIDALFRRFFIQPLHHKIKNTEFQCYSSSFKKYQKRYNSEKERYLNRVNWYVRHAHNSDFWCYVPNYLNFISSNKMNDRFWILKKPQPYIEAENLWGKNGDEYSERTFCEKQVRCPKNSEQVLKDLYGNYEKSPFVDIEKEPIKKDGQYYFSKSNQVTSFKHLKSVSFM